MSRKSRISWRRGDRDRARKIAKQFNAKITRVAKNNPSISKYLPKKVNYEDILKKSETRKDFNRKLKSLERFGKKGSELPVNSRKGATTTRYELREAQIKTRIVNNARKREAIRADVKPTKGTMGTIAQNNLKPKKLNFQNMTLKDWNKYVVSVEKQSRSNASALTIIKYKENYLKNISQRLGNAVNVQYLYNLIESIDADTLYYAYYDDPVLQINYTSDPVAVDEIVNASIAHWSRYVGREIDDTKLVDVMEVLDYIEEDYEE